jgi:hypothetical protein
MWRWCAWLAGVVLIAVAIAAVPSIMIVESYVGGSAVYGYIEDGRYFVDPGHSQPIVEVSETTWRTVYWVEWLWPWSALLPGWTGLFLTSHAMGPNWKPPPPPPKEMPPAVLWACATSGVGTVLASVLFGRSSAFHGPPCSSATSCSASASDGSAGCTRVPCARGRSIKQTLPLIMAALVRCSRSDQIYEFQTHQEPT